jgi:DNA-binding PadR family transcriptional regulator
MQPQSGYSLKKVFETTPMGNFSSSPGAIYPALKSLEKNNWVHGTPEKQDSLRPRLVYSLTDLGADVLDGELDTKVNREDLIWNYDMLMLRFAFLERRGMPQVIRFLEQLAAEIEGYVPELETIQQQMQSLPTICPRLALEQGIEGFRANLRWARRALEELRQLGNDKGDISS